MTSQEFLASQEMMASPEVVMSPRTAKALGLDKKKAEAPLSPTSMLNVTSLASSQSQPVQSKSSDTFLLQNITGSTSTLAQQSTFVSAPPKPKTVLGSSQRTSQASRSLLSQPARGSVQSTRSLLKPKATAGMHNMNIPPPKKLQTPQMPRSLINVGSKSGGQTQSFIYQSAFETASSRKPSQPPPPPKVTTSSRRGRPSGLQQYVVNSPKQSNITQSLVTINTKDGPQTLLLQMEAPKPGSKGQKGSAGAGLQGQNIILQADGQNLILDPAMAELLQAGPGESIILEPQGAPDATSISHGADGQETLILSQDSAIPESSGTSAETGSILRNTLTEEAPVMTVADTSAVDLLATAAISDSIGDTSALMTSASQDGTVIMSNEPHLPMAVDPGVGEEQGQVAMQQTYELQVPATQDGMTAVDPTQHVENTQQPGLSEDILAASLKTALDGDMSGVEVGESPGIISNEPEPMVTEIPEGAELILNPLTGKMEVMSKDDLSEMGLLTELPDIPEPEPEPEESAGSVEVAVPGGLIIPKSAADSDKSVVLGSDNVLRLQKSGQDVTIAGSSSSVGNGGLVLKSDSGNAIGSLDTSVLKDDLMEGTSDMIVHQRMDLSEQKLSGDKDKDKEVHLYVIVTDKDGKTRKIQQSHLLKDSRPKTGLKPGKGLGPKKGVKGSATVTPGSSSSTEKRIIIVDGKATVIEGKQRGK